MTPDPAPWWAVATTTPPPNWTDHVTRTTDQTGDTDHD